MGAVLIAVGLLALCSLSFCHVSLVCQKDLLRNTVLVEPKLKFKDTVDAVDASHCQHICTQHPNCHFFTFVQPDFNKKNRHYECILKGKANAHPKRVLREGVTSGYSLRACIKRPEFTPAAVYENVDFNNADYDALFTPDYEACRRVCTHEPFCQFFTFDKLHYKCYLKNSFTVLELHEVKAKKNVASGFSLNVMMDPPTLQMVANASAAGDHMLHDFDIPGHDLPKKFASCAQHCLAMCSAHPRCSFFSFDSRDNGCYLKEVSGSRKVVFKKKAKVTSGFPARFSKMDHSWLKEVREGLDFIGYELKVEDVEDAEQCQMKCTANSDCQFYTYDKKSKHRNCSHKRTVALPAPLTVQRKNGLKSGFTQKKSVCGRNPS